MAADSTQPGPGASPTDTLVHGAKSLPGPRARAGGAAPSQPSPPGLAFPPSTHVAPCKRFASKQRCFSNPARITEADGSS